MENKTDNDYIEQLKNNPEVQQWLNQFKYGNKEKFIESYVELKSKLKNKPPKEDINDSYRSNYIEIAESALEAILAKKLFDLELRWRAKELTIEGVEISYDISRWLHEPVNCPFAPEITGEDIEIMKAFLITPDFEKYKLDEHTGAWHDEIRKALNNSVDEQYWFRFYNKHASNPVPIDLPDLKGAKEEYYFDMHREFNKEDNAKIKAQTSTYLETEERYKLIAKLAEATGLKDFVNYINDKNYRNKGRNPVYTDYAWYYLNIHYYDQVPIKSNKNWAEALLLAYQQHAAREAVKHLQTVVDTYRIKKENNITQENSHRSFEHIAKRFRDIILETREKLGEPVNFDY